MKDLLAIEWLKVKGYRTFWVLLALFAGFLVIFNYGIEAGIFRVGRDINVLSTAYSFPLVWDNMAFYASIFVLFLSILIIILTTNEYQFRTNRQNVIDGWTRLKFFHAKWATIGALAVATTIYVSLVGLTFGASNGGFDDVLDHLYKMFYFFVLCINYFGFALLLAILLKRSGLAISLFLLYCLIIEVTLHFWFKFGLHFNYGDLFLPLQCSDETVPLTLSAMLSNALKQTGPSDVAYIIASLCWITIYYFIGRRVLLKSDW